MGQPITAEYVESLIGGFNKTPGRPERADDDNGGWRKKKSSSPVVADSGYKSELAFASGVEDFDRLLSELVRLSAGGTNARERYLKRVIEMVEEARALYVVYCT